MNPSLKNALISAAVLAAIAFSSVLLLTLANAVMPQKQYASADGAALASVLNGLAPTGVGDAEAHSGGYFDAAMEPEALNAWNTANKSSAARRVVAVYKALKGESAGTLFVETETKGYESTIVLMVALNPDGTFIGISVRSIAAIEYYSPENLAAINAFIKGKSAVTAAQLKPLIFSGASAGITTTAFINALNLAAKISGEVSADE